MSRSAPYYICPNLAIIRLDGYCYFSGPRGFLYSTEELWIRAADLLRSKLVEPEASIRQSEFVDQVSQGEFSALAQSVYAFEALKLRAFIRENPFARHLTPEVTGDGECYSPQWEEAKRLAGLADDPVEVVLVRDYLEEWLVQANRDRVRAGSDWMPVCLYGRSITLGPVFSPRHGCYECLRPRLIDCRFPARHYEETRRLYDRSEELIGCHKPFTGFFCVAPGSAFSESTGLLAATVVKRYLEDFHAGGASFGNDILSVDVQTLATEHHPYNPYPQCPVCGDPSLAWPGAPDLTDAPENSRRWRAWGGKEGIAAVSRLCDSFSGTVVESPDHSSESNGFYSVNVRHPFFSSLWDRKNPLHLSNQRIYYYGSGQATTRSAAMAWAICEASERMAAAMPFVPPGEDGPLIKACHSELREALGSRVIHPNAIDLFSRRQLESAGEQDSDFDRPSNFDDDESVYWNEAYKIDPDATNLLQSEPFYLPLEKVRAGIGFPGAVSAASDLRLLWTSNGAAAGATHAEACFSGLMELVERDCVGIWWFNRIRRPRLDIAADECPFYRETKSWLAKRGYDLWVLDLTNDIGIPAYAGVASRVSDGGAVAFGFSGHVDPAICLEETLKETLQTYTAVDGYVTGKEKHVPKRMSRWVEGTTLATVDYLVPSDGDGVPLAPAPARVEGCEAGIRYAVRKLNAVGLDAYCVDVSRPDLPVKVVHTFSPGIRCMWKRFGPGRLYSVPKKLGWIEEELTEEDMNPTSVWF